MNDAILAAISFGLSTVCLCFKPNVYLLLLYFTFIICVRRFCQLLINERVCVCGMY